MDEEDLQLSSPDPLGNSSSNLPYSTPTKGKAKQCTPKKPLADANGNVRLQDFYLDTPSAYLSGTSSPTKTTAKAENLISPWRIRVTVEAEREDEKENPHQLSKSPGKQLAERTITTIVPLKGAHDSSPAPAKRGRGRPRKSLDSPVKRIGTPKPRKTGRRKTQGDSLPEHSERDAFAGITPPKRGRGRPRKSVESNVDDLWLASGQTIDEDQTPATACVDAPTVRETTSRRKSRGRRKAMTPVKPTTDQDSSSQVEEGNGPDYSDALQRDTTHVGALDKDSVYASEPHNSHKRMDPTDEHEEFDSILESEGFSMVSISSIPSAQQHLSSPAEDGQAIQREAPELHSDSMQVNQTGHMRINVPFEGQASPSRHLRNPVLQRLSGPEQSSILSYLPSSPPIFNPQHQPEPSVQRQTPSLIPSSPSLPPPKQSIPPPQSPRSLDKPTDGTPKLARVVRAGTALQGALSPPKAGGRSGSPVQQRLSSSSSVKSPKERLDDLFSGFGAGTRRELRAGLRLGEELAKNQAGRRISPRQEPAQVVKQSSTTAEDMDVFLEDASLAYPRLPTPDDKEEYTLSLPGSQQIEYPAIPNEQLPSPARSAIDDLDDRMSWTADTPVKPVLSPPSPPENAVSPEMSRVFRDDTMMLDWKAEWQREREAVSQQIQSASESQVIVIHSDDSDVAKDTDQSGVTDEQETDADHQHLMDEDGADADQSELMDEEEADEDIWQAEAHLSDPVREATPDISEMLFQDEVIKPRRSKLPSPWRRNSQVVYSDEVQQEEFDLFWQPNQRPASNRARQRQEPSNTSVLSEYVTRDQSQHLSPVEGSPAQSLVMDQDSAIYEVEEKIVVEEETIVFEPVAEEETILETSHTSDDNSHTDEISQRHEENPAEKSLAEKTLTEASLPSPSPSPTQPTLPQQSWYHRLASLASSYLLPSAPHPPPSYPILDTPLSRHYPWTQPHWLALNALYKDSKLHPQHYPFRPGGRAAWLLDMEVVSQGWERGVDEVWCGVVEVFCDAYLSPRGGEEGGDGEGEVVGGAGRNGGNGGEAEGEVGGRRKRTTGLIDETEVVLRIFGLWVCDVRRGLVSWDGPRGG